MTAALFLSLLLLTATAQSKAPKLIRSIPIDGAINVPLQQNKILLFFDQNMKMDSWSLMQSSTHPFPPLIPIEEPWIDPLTFEFNIKSLTPNTTYSIQLNGKKRKGFAASEGQLPLPITTITFTTTNASQATAQVNKKVRADIPQQTKAYAQPNSQYRLEHPTTWQFEEDYSADPNIVKLIAPSTKAEFWIISTSNESVETYDEFYLSLVRPLAKQFGKELEIEPLDHTNKAGGLKWYYGRAIVNTPSKTLYKYSLVHFNDKFWSLVMVVKDGILPKNIDSLNAIHDSFIPVQVQTPQGQDSIKARQKNKTAEIHPGWQFEVTRSIGMEGTESYENGYQAPFRVFQKIMFKETVSRVVENTIQEVNREILSAKANSLNPENGQMVGQDLVPLGTRYQASHASHGYTLFDANTGLEIWDTDMVVAFSPPLIPKLWPRGALQEGQKWSYRGAELVSRIALLDILGGEN